MERILELKFLRSARLLLAHASELNGMALADEPFSDLAALGLPRRWVATGTDSVDRRVVHNDDHDDHDDGGSAARPSTKPSSVAALVTAAEALCDLQLRPQQPPAQRVELGGELAGQARV